MVDKALDVKDKITKGIFPPHFLYGGIKLEKQKKAKIIESNIKNIFNLKKGDIVVTNRLKYILLMKILRRKSILINMNSNHDLTKKSGLKNKLIYAFNKLSYLACSHVVCLSKIQLSKLKNVGVKRASAIPLGVEKSLVDAVKKSKEYFLSSGFDKGKNYGFIKKALKNEKIKILDGKNPLTYVEYLKVLGKAKAIVFNIDVTKENSSDLSGTTTCFETLLMKKPIFINDQPWLKELYKKNYYIYKNEEDLRKIINKKINFQELDYSYLTLENFTKELAKIIKRL